MIFHRKVVAGFCQRTDGCGLRVVRSQSEYQAIDRHGDVISVTNSALCLDSPGSSTSQGLRERLVTTAFRSQLLRQEFISSPDCCRKRPNITSAFLGYIWTNLGCSLKAKVTCVFFALLLYRGCFLQWPDRVEKLWTFETRLLFQTFIPRSITIWKGGRSLAISCQKDVFALFCEASFGIVYREARTSELFQTSGVE